MTAPLPHPPFEKPWHAQVFALAVHLSEQGHFTWPEWAEAFGAELARASALHAHPGTLNGSSDYYDAWMATLEQLCAARGLADSASLATLKAAWETAYLTAQHGQPVHLPD